ncbi:MAG: hypothetical protein ACRDN9_05295 [Streptosporangiaceae bacterium]
MTVRVEQMTEGGAGPMETSAAPARLSRRHTGPMSPARPRRPAAASGGRRGAV